MNYSYDPHYDSLFILDENSVKVKSTHDALFHDSCRVYLDQGPEVLYRYLFL